MNDLPKKLQGEGDFPTYWNRIVTMLTGLIHFTATPPLYVSRVQGGWSFRLANFGTRVYELVDSLYVGQTNPTSTAKLCEWNADDTTWTTPTGAAEVEIYPGVVNGYHFEGDKILVANLGGNLTCVSAGAFYARGTTSGTLNASGSISLTVRSNKTITVWGYFGTTSTTKKVGATWDDYDHKWYVGDSEC